jgi:hypothetical protein
LDHRKAERVAFQNGIRDFGVSANLSLEIEDPFSRCSVQKEKTAAALIIKILDFLNRLADRVV